MYIGLIDLLGFIFFTIRHHKLLKRQKNTRAIFIKYFLRDDIIIEVDHIILCSKGGGRLC